jgi:hypothetical protein
MYEGDIIQYNLSAYGFDIDIILQIVHINPDRDSVVMKPIDGRWPMPFEHWRPEEALNPDYIQGYIYTIAPQTPPRIN